MYKLFSHVALCELERFDFAPQQTVADPLVLLAPTVPAPVEILTGMPSKLETSLYN